MGVGPDFVKPSDRALEVLSNDNCSLIIFVHSDEISGMLQLTNLRVSLSFNQKNFYNLVSLCENPEEEVDTYKIFKHSDEKYPIIWQLSSDLRIYLKENEWQDVRQIIFTAKSKYCEIANA